VCCAVAFAGSASGQTPEPQPDARVASFELRGAGDLEDELLERLVLRDRGWAFWRSRPAFDPLTLEDDVERAIRFYQSLGFYEATVEAEVEAVSDDRVNVELVIARGEPTLLRSVRVRWADDIGEIPFELDDIVASLPLRIGEPFGSRLYGEAREALLDALAETGYPLASLEGGARVTLEDRSASVRWRIRPGPGVRIGPIEFVGLERVDEVLVRRELTVAPDDAFSPSALRETERGIYASGLFRSVAARPVRPEEPDLDEPETTWPIEITLQERKRRNIRLGGGWGTEDEFRVRGEWHHRNLFGQAETLDILGKYSAIVAGVEVRYRDPSFIDPDIALEVPLGFEREKEPGYDVNRSSVGVELNRPMFDFWRFALGYRFELANPTDIDTDPFARNEETVLLSSISLRARRSDVDDLFEPTHGSVVELAVRPTLSALGSDLDSVEVTAGLRWYRSLYGVVLALRVDAGTIEPFANTSNREIPVFERFFAGGSTSVRGYDRHAIGLTDDDGDPLGGLTWAEASSELRFPIWKALSGVVFFDAGQIRTRPHAWTTRDVFSGYGGGIRIRTPVGPIRFDVGVPLRKEPTTENFEVYFSIGHAF
jgi:outer membrane protein assembly complex protein YaeT